MAFLSLVGLADKTPEPKKGPKRQQTGTIDSEAEYPEIPRCESAHTPVTRK